MIGKKTTRGRPGAPQGAPLPLDLSGYEQPATPTRGPDIDWPSAQRFPHNESGSTVGSVLAADLAAASDVLLITGYASLERIIRLLARRDLRRPQRVRLLLGNEPHMPRSPLVSVGAQQLVDEIRRYWLQRGVSVLLAADLVRARAVLCAAGVEVRIGQTGKPLHAKLYLSETAVTIGSSNYTERGLGSQSEANVRFLASERERYAEAVRLAEGLWLTGQDYRNELVALLDMLLRAVPWQEALARACGSILEGDWARQYVPPEALGMLKSPLWPHQLQGISQALWIIENVGSVLVCDATGSGKTRMGAWLLRGSYDRQVRLGGGQRAAPLVLSPPQVVEIWEHNLREASLPWKVQSHGPLSNKKAAQHQALIEAISTTELLAVDEAHNFLNDSARTRRLLEHHADHAVMFTATPINRSAADLLALIELLGADNLSDEALAVFNRLYRLRRRGKGLRMDAEVARIRAEIEKFMVRRTRADLNRIAGDLPSAYLLPSGRRARYPRHEARYYACDAPAEDLRLGQQICALADQLIGVGRLGSVLKLPRSFAFLNITEEQYLYRLVGSAHALARHLVLACLRSSRAALYEHIHGTRQTLRDFGLKLHLAKHETGETLRTLSTLAGRPPDWRLTTVERAAVPAWLWEADAHLDACAHDEAIYRRMGELARQMSSARELAKQHQLSKLLDAKRMVIAFDSHVITLALFQQELHRHGYPVALYTGQGGGAAKRRALRELGNDSRVERLIALCSDALSEGMNLQAASCVVHLDTPTVIRTAEQRAGRVDRMDSRHDVVEIWWPRDPATFAPRRRDLLRERHEVVSDLIGANLQLPDPEEADEVVDIAELAQQSDITRTETRSDVPALYDAFRPVRALIGAGGLVPEPVYRSIRDSQSQVVTLVSMVRALRPWAFFAVGGRDRSAPRWVLFPSLDGGPLSDLSSVAEGLRTRLAGSPQPETPDDAAMAWLQRFLLALHKAARVLLPVRRQRALDLAERVLCEYQQRASQDHDSERRIVLAAALRLFDPPPDEPHPDLRGVAESWLQIIRPYQRRALEQRRSRRRPWTLNDLEPLLQHDPLPTGELRRLATELPVVPPVSERVVATIIGVPRSG